ncbi:hypothetical protein Gohar_016817 [Gossypium harknessii]|uniref:Uncharacterized protein n=1 Tax=Gossypium harknessii TaxID=34285 RepID=A0A7J9G4L5_9ROSI|nr:hypothetical protein [Gossypium harknessii]
MELLRHHHHPRLFPPILHIELHLRHHVQLKLTVPLHQFQYSVASTLPIQIRMNTTSLLMTIHLLLIHPFPPFPL